MPSRSDANDIRDDVSYVLRHIGRELVADPKSPRPLKLLSDRLQGLCAESDDPDLLLLSSYVTLYVNDLFFNALTDVSAMVEVSQRDSIIESTGKALVALSDALKEQDQLRAYRGLQELGSVWCKWIPALSQTSEPVAPPPVEEDLSPTIGAFLSYPAKKTSHHHLASGQRSSYHMDLDFLTLDPTLAEQDSLVEYYAEAVGRARAEKRISKLAFIDKASGPVGAIALSHALVSKTGLGGVFVRLRRRSPFYQVKGDLGEGDKIAIVSDISTSGEGIAQAKEMIAINNPAVAVPVAIVFYDREQGARERLASHGMELEAIFTRASLKQREEFPVPLSDEIVSPSNEQRERLRELFGEDTASLLERSFIKF